MVWSHLLLAASSNWASPLPPYTPVLPNQIKRENADSPEENECWTIKKQPQCCKPAMKLEDKTANSSCYQQDCKGISPTGIWAWLVSKPPWAGLGVSLLWTRAEDVSHITQCVASNIFRSSRSPWIFLSKTTSERQLTKAPHTGPQDRAVLDGNLWIFWNLIKTGRLLGLLIGEIQRHRSSASADRWCSALFRGAEPSNCKHHAVLPILLVSRSKALRRPKSTR